MEIKFHRFKSPISGRNLLFEVEVADVREATDEELDHGHVHEYENEE